MVTQFKYKLWFSSSLRNLRAKTSCIPTKNVYVSLRQIRLYHWNLLFIFTKNLRSRLSSVRTSRKTDFPETKNNFGDNDISQPTPSVSLSVLSCSLGSIWNYLIWFKLYLLRFWLSQEITKNYGGKAKFLSQRVLLLFSSNNRNLDIFECLTVL